jgi:hypothetical protein
MKIEKSPIEMRVDLDVAASQCKFLNATFLLSATANRNVVPCPNPNQHLGLALASSWFTMELISSVKSWAPSSFLECTLINK